MKVRTTTLLRCSPDEAWEALHTPLMAAELYGSFVKMVFPDNMPPRFDNDHAVTVRLLFADRIPMGRQRIKITDRETRIGAWHERVMCDSGGALSGPLSLVNHWRHEMAITADPASPERARIQDALSFQGFAAPFVWPVLAVVWRWRQLRIARVSERWVSSAARSRT